LRDLLLEAFQDSNSNSSKKKQKYITFGGTNRPIGIGNPSSAQATAFNFSSTLPPRHLQQSSAEISHFFLEQGLVIQGNPFQLEVLSCK
jgi:hypothetical protein